MIRVIFVIVILVALALVLLPFQAVAMLTGSNFQRTIPYWFHRILCAVIGARVRQVGNITRETPVLILSNHVSWLDISVIGALTPVVFVAKSEVANWPVFGWLARLQRTIFIERDRRHKTGDATKAMGERLIAGDAVLFFPEGTSSDGVRILPFRSALIGAVHHAIGDATHHRRVMVQPLSLAYTRFGGIPVGRALRDKVAWYGETELLPHLFGVLAAGAIDITVSWGEPIVYDINSDRKIIARDAESSVRRMTAKALRAPAETSLKAAAATPVLRQP